MTVRSLSDTPFDELVDCFLSAFENYYVKMPTDKSYYQQRWEAAKVRYDLSYGMFDNDKLVGFIIHAIDNRAGAMTAFNTGTGVIPEYRGKRIVKSIYEYALQDLKQQGIEKSTLEVITENEKAIKAYQSVGFEICKKYRCYAGDIHVEYPEQPKIKEINFQDVDWDTLPNQHAYSWDFQKETLVKGRYRFYQVLNRGIPESFFIINPHNQYVAQLDLLNTENKGWERLFAAIRQVSDSVKINNIDERQTDKLDSIIAAGLKGTVNQYEMELHLARGNTV